MKLKKLLMTALVIACGATSIAAVAANTMATPGYRIFNQSSGMSAATYTTGNPTSCTGVTFPTPIDANNNAPITVTSGFQLGSVCSTQYTSSYTGGTCLVTITSDGGAGAITMYATPMGAPCSAINGNTAVVLN